MRSWSLFEGSRGRSDDERASTDVDATPDDPDMPSPVADEALGDGTDGDGADGVEAASCPLLPDLEDDVFELLAQLFAEPGEPEPLDVMQKRVKAYLDEVHSAFHQNEYIDIDLVETLGDLADALLGAAEDMPADSRRLAHAAVEYFVRSDDAHADLIERTGFGDDMDVLTAVTRYLERDDLLPKRL